MTKILRLKFVHQNNRAWWDFAQKSVQLDFWKDEVFRKVSLFHREMFCLTSFLLVLRICIVNAMIFIKKNIDKLVKDQFLQHVKDHPCGKFGYVGKNKPFFFLQTRKN